jgi:Ca2+-binding EF-hand superfamily protein
MHITKQGKIKISSIIQFRTSLSCLNTTVPFGPAFGNAATRQECIVSTEELFRRLLLATPNQSNGVLTFDTLAMVAIDEYGNLNEDKIRELIRVFRPDREGNLTLIDFAKSIDSVYK